MWKIRQTTFVSSFRFVEEKKKENNDNFKAFCVTRKRNKNHSFIPMFKTNKQKIHIEMESFFRFVKLKAYLKVQYNEKVNTEDHIFKPQSNKNCTPNKNHRTIKTYIEATERELKERGYQ